MKKIVVFGGSNSKSSINKQLAIYASSLLSNVEIQILDLNDFSMPIFGVDIEQLNGIPNNAHHFLDFIQKTDGIIISLAEHNGSYTTAFKNLFDWTSRINGQLWNNKPMLILSTSPGLRGGKSVLEAATSRFPYMGAKIVATFSLPSFNDNFKNGELLNKDLKEDLLEVVKQFQAALI